MSVEGEEDAKRCTLCSTTCKISLTADGEVKSRKDRAAPVDVFMNQLLGLRSGSGSDL